MEAARKRRTPLFLAPRTVIGYHGCSQRAAKKIIAEGRFLPSTNAYDWLGEGIYFWEYAPYRALDWAKIKCGDSGEEPAVVGVKIKLGRCLNLLDTAHSKGLIRAYSIFQENLVGRKMPRNTDTGAHFLDCEVIDTYCLLMAAENRNKHQTVRGCYPEGLPVYAGSKILSLAHVQIAVRDPSCISNIHLVQLP